MQTRIEFIANVEPHGKQRARTVTMKNGFTHSYTPKQTVAFERAIAWAYKSAKAGCFAPYEPLELTVWCYMPVPKSASKRQYERLIGDWHTKKPDGSNIVKSVEDALNKLAYSDDGQIAALHVYKVYGHKPSVNVSIRRLKPRHDTIIDEGSFENVTDED